MICACQRKSLRIFIQSVSHVQIADSATTHNAARQLSSRIRQTPTSKPFPRHTRPFTITSDAAYPRRTWKSPPTALESDPASPGPRSRISPTQASSNPHATEDRAQPAVASADTVRLATQDGAIYDMSPESIASLAAQFETQLNTSPPQPSPETVTDQNEQEGMPTRERTKKAKAETPAIATQDVTKAPRAPLPGHKREEWQIQKDALEKKFPGGWNPRKRLSPDALEGIRALHAQFPEEYSTEVLANKFEVSPEAIRRILKSKWTPSADEDLKRQERWFKRGKQIWAEMAKDGKKPPKKWRREGVVRAAHWNEKKRPRQQWPYVPRWKENESAQRKLSENLL